MELLSVEALLSIAERFQTTLVGILGFVGVILTLLHNARQTKRQNERAINNEQASICAALHAELEIYRDALLMAITDYEKAQTNTSEKIAVPVNSMSSVYAVLLPKIGMLSSQKVRAVMYAYLTADELHRSLILFSGHGADYKRDGDYVWVNVTRAHELAKMSKSLLPHLDKAIREIAPSEEKY